MCSKIPCLQLHLRFFTFLQFLKKACTWNTSVHFFSYFYQISQRRDQIKVFFKSTNVINSELESIGFTKAPIRENPITAFVFFCHLVVARGLVARWPHRTRLNATFCQQKPSAFSDFCSLHLRKMVLVIKFVFCAHTTYSRVHNIYRGKRSCVSH